MAGYDNGYTNGSNGRFGNRYKSWKSYNETRTDTYDTSDIYRDHICKPVIVGPDGRDMPMVLDCPPKNHHKGTRTLVDGSAYRVQSDNMYLKEYMSGDRKKHQKGIMAMVDENAYRVQPGNSYLKEYMPGDRKTGISGSMFQSPKPNYTSSDPIRKGEWAEPVLKGAADYLMDSAGPKSDSGLTRVGLKAAEEYFVGSTKPKSDSGLARVGLKTAEEYLMGSIRPKSDGSWAKTVLEAAAAMGSSGPKPDIGRVRPISAGWSSPQLDGRLGKVTDNISAAAGYLEGSVGPMGQRGSPRLGGTKMMRYGSQHMMQ